MNDADIADGESRPARRDRLYQELARALLADFAAAGYRPGDRLPPERELAQRYNVSRPTVREALIALEVQGMIEVRIGSGAYLCAVPDEGAQPADFGVSAFEVTEARLLIEPEVAALAAAQIGTEELAQLATLVDGIAQENARNAGTESADREFHLTIARASRNAALLRMVEDLWSLRAASAETALLYAKARAANIQPVVAEHTAILHALEAGDPAGARAAMRAHLTAVLDSLLFATEERAIEEARQASLTRRARLAHTIE
ncbi:FadR/GntR family transcriptional regulator [Croceibacterium sp. TMG7-5b_MA50]|uniref:FadR/GntR family transcriptional regulator n=1 Tax=Croceibacterium sp. TMG7-5b_MA50 TaxID=3121290 RepID=UPI003221E056